MARPKATRKNSTPKMTKTDAQRVQQLQAARTEKLKSDISKMKAKQMRETLLALATRMPGLVFDIIGSAPAGGSGDPNPTPPTNQTVPEWCKCHRCIEMPTLLENKCCGLKPEHCISQRPEMDLYILDPGVLGIANGYRANLLAHNNRHDNQARRHDAYRQFVLWQFGRLGHGNRRVVPSCCVCRIRAEYPDANGVYTGYRPTATD